MSRKIILRIMKIILRIAKNISILYERLCKASGNYALSAWNFRASECRAELVRAMPSAAENLEEEALQSVATITGYEVPG